MKQMKRIMALLLCAVMVLSNLPMTALAAGAANVTCSASAKQVTVGDEITVVVKNGAMTQEAFACPLIFDNELLELIGIQTEYPEDSAWGALKTQSGGWVGANAFSTIGKANENGQIGFSVHGREMQYAEGTIYTATFKAKNPGTAKITLKEDSDGTDGYKGTATELYVEIKKDTPNIAYTLSDKKVSEGETVTVTVTNADMSLKAFTCTLGFDNTLLKCVSIENEYPDDPEWAGLKTQSSWAAADAFSNPTVANELGLVGFALSGTRERNFVAGTVFTATFEALKTGTASFTLTEDSAGADGFAGQLDPFSVEIVDKCPHTTQKEVFTSNNDGKTHTKSVVCAADCGKVYGSEIVEDCSGGQATCDKKAVCKYCGQSYGDVSHNYGELIPEKEPVHTQEKLEAGVDAHYQCKDCGKLFTENKVETDIEKLTGETPTHDETRKESTSDADCENAGQIVVQTFCSQCGLIHGTDTQPDPEHPALGHDWALAGDYAWRDDYLACTAQIKCQREKCGEERSVTGTVTSQTKPSTCSAAGETVYTAAFAYENWTGSATKTVPIDMDPDAHAWNTEPDSYINVDETHHTPVYTCQHNAAHTMQGAAATHTYVNGICACDEKQNYTVTWKDEKGNVHVTDSVEHGESVDSIPVPSKPGYTGTWVGDSTENVTGNVVLQAEYKPNNYQINWMVDGKPYTWTEDEQPKTHTVVVYDTAIEVPDVAPTKTGHTFQGWYTDENGNGLKIQDGETDYNFDTIGQQNVLSVLADEEITISGQTSLYAHFTPNTYNAVFNADGGAWADGDAAKTVPVVFGQPIEAPEDPTREGYTFTGWTPAVDAMDAEGMTYTATWSINSYDVTWIVDGKTTTEEYEYGATPSFKGTTDKAADAQYTYTFAGWTPEIADVTGEATYTAQYNQTVNKYSVTWIVDGKTTTEEYEYGATPSFTGSTDKAADAQYTYTFDGWDKEIVAVSGDVTYTAKYRQTVNEYTVTWIVDGVTTTEEYKYGATPSFKGTTDKAADAQYTYTFDGWDKEIVAVSGDVTYTAKYSQTVNKYRVTWIVDGVTTTEEYDYGATPSFKGSTDKAASPQYTYTFAGWTPEIAPVTGEATYTATYNQAAKEYTVTLAEGYKSYGVTIQNPVAVFGQAYETQLVPASEKEHIRIISIKWASNARDITKDSTFDQTTNTLTVPADKINSDLVIEAYSYVNLSLDPNAIDGYICSIWKEDISNAVPRIPAEFDVKHGERFSFDLGEFYLEARRSGYTFTGWNTKSDGTGTPYAADTTELEVTEDTTLYAQWECKHDSKSYVDNGDGTHDYRCANGCVLENDVPHDFTKNEEHQCVCGLVCSHSYKLDTKKGENGYTWGQGYDTCTAHGICNTCGDAIDATINHSNNAVSVVMEPGDCVTPNTYVYTANFAGVASWAKTVTKRVPYGDPIPDAHPTDAIEFRDNEDGTHDGYCEKCGKPIDGYEKQSHDFTKNDAHQCVCGLVETFSVTLYDGGLNVVAIDKKSAKFGENFVATLTHPAPHILVESAGYPTESGYTGITDQVVLNGNILTIPAECIQGNIKITVKPYTKLTIHPNGGKIFGSEETSVRGVEYGAKMVLHSVSKPCHTLAAMSTGADGTGTSYQLEYSNIDGYILDASAALADATLYAQWEFTGHTYDNDCDTDCNGCGEVRETTHTYALDTDQGTGGYQWADDYSSCTAYGKCGICGEPTSVTVKTTSREKAPANCAMSAIWEFTADFSETWTEDQTTTHLDPHGPRDPNNHTRLTTDMDLGDGTHGKKCTGCWKVIGEPEPHYPGDMISEGNCQTPAVYSCGNFFCRASCQGEVNPNIHVWNETPSSYTNNGDTHTAHYVCTFNQEHTMSGEPENHDYTYDKVNHKCACGKVETYAVTVTDYKNSVVLDGEYTATYGQTLTVKLKNNINNGSVSVRSVKIGETEYTKSQGKFTYDDETNTLTIDGSIITDDVTINADALVTIEIDLGGGHLFVPEEFKEQYPTLEDLIAELEEMGRFKNGKLYYSEIYDDDAKVTNFGAFVAKEGHTCKGLLDENGELFDSYIWASGDRKMTLAWEPNPYNVILKDGDKTLLTIVDCYGDTLTLNYNATKEGHTFTGWNTKPDGSGDAFADSLVIPAHDVTLYAQWEINTYNVIWKIGEETVFTSQVKYGQTITDPDLEIPESYFGVKWDSFESTMGAEDVTVNGQWTVYLAILNEDGTSQSFEQYTLGDIAYADYRGSYYKEGHTFWLVNANDETEKYPLAYESGMPKWPAVMMTKNLTLKPVFEVITYTITWENSDGSLLAEENVAYGTTPAYPKAQDPIYTNPETGYKYTFVGWASEMNGEKLDTIPAVSGEATYYAVYEKTVRSYWLEWMVKGFKNDGSDVGYQLPDSVEFGTPITAPRMTWVKEGYTFTGWQNVPETMPAEDLVIYGEFVVNKHDITWTVDGKTTTVEDVVFGTKIQLPEEPTKEGYNFVGWEGYTADMTMPDKDVTFTAKWEAKTYTVTWTVDGKTYTTTEATYGEAIALPETDPEKIGHTFTGWAEVPETMPDNENLVIAAEFTANTYQVHWKANGGSFYFGTSDSTVTEQVFGAEIATPSYNAYVRYPGYTFTGWNTKADGSGEMLTAETKMTVASNTELIYYAQWEHNGYTITWDVDGVKTTTTVKAGQIPVFEGTPEKAADETFTYTFARWDKELVPATEATTYTAVFTRTGWDGDKYLVEDEVQKNGWTQIGDNWYYLDPTTGDRAKGTARVPYPADVIDGNTYAPAAGTIDAELGWFLFGEDGKFLSGTTGIGTYYDATRYALNGHILWNPGLVEVDDAYYYFTGDETKGGNILVTGDIEIAKNSTDRNVTIGGTYTFGEDGKLCEYDGITDMANGTKRYYKDAQLMKGAGLVKIEDEKYIFVRANGELVVGKAYWVPKNDLNVKSGIYSFDDEGFMINPIADVQDGFYYENGGWYCYRNGKLAGNLGLIQVTNAPWFQDGKTVQTGTGLVYVRSNGQLAVGTYYITNVSGYTGTDYESGDKLPFNEYGLLANLKNGIYAENGSLYYYVDNSLAYNAGVIQLDGKYYYVKSNAEVVNGKSYWITNVGNSGAVAKQYTFAADGTFEPVFTMKEGIIDGYYYVNDKIAYAAGLLKLSDENGEFYIYVRSNGQLATGKYWPTTTNGYDVSGQMDFGEDGKLYL